MTVEGIKQGALDAGAKVVSATQAAGQWLGRTVSAAGRQIASTAAKAWQAFVAFLGTAKTYLTTMAKYSQAKILEGFYATKAFLILNKSAALGVGAGVLVTSLVFATANYMKSEK